MITKVEDQQLKAFLVDAGTVDKKALNEAEKKAKKEEIPLGEVLVDQELLTEEEYLKMQAYILGVPFVDLSEEQVDPEVLRIIPEPIARQNNIVAFRKKGNELEVAMLDPQDLGTIDFIKKKSNLKVKPRLTTDSGIKKVLQQYSKSLQAEFGDIIQKEVDDIKTVSDDKEQVIDQSELQKAAEEMPVIRIVDTLLKHAILQRASDVHVEPTDKEVVVRYRIDGVLHDAMVLPKHAASGIVARIKVLSDLKLDEHRLPQDGRFKVETDGYKYSIRVSILPVFDGEKVVMRLLSESAHGFTLDDLGFRGEALHRVERSLKKPIGMILVTGPTGSGKTTTLYAMMEILNTPDVNISTVEDPIEYRMPRINQTQIRSKIGLTFANGLRSLLRQDPDIIMVGEIRDGETASLAINASLTGHMVLSTIHTSDAPGAIPRFIDMGVEPFLLSSTLSVIIGQRLVRKLDDNKEQYNLTKKEVDDLSEMIDVKNLEEVMIREGIMDKGHSLIDIPFYRPKASKDNPEGYKGRLGIYEVLPVTETIKDMIGKNASGQDIQKQAREEDMVTMVEDGFIKAAQGVTSIEEVLRVINE